jgi:hypothetical protein
VCINVSYYGTSESLRYIYADVKMEIISLISHFLCETDAEGILQNFLEGCEPEKTSFSQNSQEKQIFTSLNRSLKRMAIVNRGKFSIFLKKVVEKFR